MSEPILQAIVTKYYAATQKVKAVSASGKSITIPVDDELIDQDMHKAAAMALAKKLGWDRDLVQGAMKDGYVFVLVPKGRASNPAPRIGAAKPRRKSQVTGEKPSMRLVQRRKKNTRKGYYPNPISKFYMTDEGNNIAIWNGESGECVFQISRYKDGDLKAAKKLDELNSLGVGEGRFVVSVKESTSAKWKKVAVIAGSDKEAKAYAKKLASSHPTWSIKVDKE